MKITCYINIKSKPHVTSTFLTLLITSQLEHISHIHRTISQFQIAVKKVMSKLCMFAPAQTQQAQTHVQTSQLSCTSAASEVQELVRAGGAASVSHCQRKPSALVSHSRLCLPLSLQPITACRQITPALVPVTVSSCSDGCLLQFVAISFTKYCGFVLSLPLHFILYSVF